MPERFIKITDTRAVPIKVVEQALTQRTEAVPHLSITGRIQKLELVGHSSRIL
jgi:hypothetical protein